MKSTMEILTKLQENSQKNHDEIFTRLYRYLLRPDIYFIAYQHLYSNKGAGTKGVNDDMHCMRKSRKLKEQCGSS